MTVPIEIGDDFAYGNPTSVFGTSYSRGRDSRNYDISPDGERFLMVKESGTSSSELTLVLNWFEELKRRVPANN